MIFIEVKTSINDSKIILVQIYFLNVYSSIILYFLTTKLFWGFPGLSDSKESACNAGDLGSIPGFGRSPGEELGNPLQYSCLENPHGQRILVGYSPLGSKELHTTGGLNTAQAVFRAWFLGRASYQILFHILW